MKTSRAATARRQIPNTILGAGPVAVALQATSAGLVNAALSTGKWLPVDALGCAHPASVLTAGVKSIGYITRAGRVT
jgi:hypothetical protein